MLASKVFTFTPDYDYRLLDAREVIKGGTGYDIPGRLPEAVENIRKCPFCLVREKEGYIQAVEPVELNPKGKWIEVLDNNFFANPQ